MTTTSSTRQRILRNCQGDFYGDEILNSLHTFNDAYFAGIREGGYNAIWLRGQLRELVAFDEAPHWNNKTAERMAALNQIVETGQRNGVGIYLYFNEPNGLDKGDPLLDKYPDLQGPPNPLADHLMVGDFERDYAFCTQSSFTETYLVGGFEKLFKQSPNLAGVLLITASEILSHCYSNVDEKNLLNEDFKFREVQCPRCNTSTSIATVIDVVEKIRKGIRASSPTAKIVAWNWSWGMYEEAPQKSIIAGLSEDVVIMCDMQRGGSKTVENIDMIVDEYSFSYLGPSPLFIGTAEVAKRTGHELWAKIMVNVTHEFLVTPYLPLPFRLAKKMIAVRDYNSRGLMGCWNYGGNATTYMAQLGSKAFTDESFTVEEINDEVHRIATRIYGSNKGDVAYRAWQTFDEAFEYFPFDMALIYYGPHMHGTGLEWVFAEDETPMPWYWMKGTGRTTNNLSAWCTYFTPEQVVYLLGKLTDRWKKGVEILANAFEVEDAFDSIPQFEHLVSEPGFEDFCIARTIYLHFMSSIAFIKFRLATIAYFQNEKREVQEKTISSILQDEKPRVRAMSQIIKAYPHIPAADEAQQLLYTVEDLKQRLTNIEQFSFASGQRI